MLIDRPPVHLAEHLARADAEPFGLRAVLDLDDDDPALRVAVVEVEAGSKAERLGVRPGQVLREVNGRPVE